MPILPITAVVITCNEEVNIERCLKSVSFCAEIIVVDSGSNDKTVEIAQACGALVTSQEWLGYGPQKQFAAERASYDWVLCLDADEVVSPQLAKSVQTLDFDKASPVAYKMPRRNHFMGKALFHGEGYPDRSLRLFNRNFCHWGDERVHESVHFRGEVGLLDGDLLHYSEESITSYLVKQNRYTELQAQSLFESGRSASFFQCITSPLARFIKFYFFRLGFLDGFAGFVHISIGCMNAFFKYTKLIELQLKSNKNGA